jgi:hypothetical protein
MMKIIIALPEIAKSEKAKNVQNIILSLKIILGEKKRKKSF